jgi:ribosome-interacting GTPase 1
MAMASSKYIPCLYVLNKIDTITVEELDLLDRVPHYVPICAGREWGFDDLLEKMWQYLNMLRMCAVAGWRAVQGCLLTSRLRSYTKPRGQIPDYDAPVVIPRGAARRRTGAADAARCPHGVRARFADKNTVDEFCLRIHKALREQFK